MKMKVKEFIKMWEDGTHNDIDVYDNVCEELGIAFCGGYKLSKEGREKFKEALEFEIDVDEDPRYPVAVVDVDGDEGVWQKKLKQAKELFYSLAGYCDDELFNKWFIELA